MSDNPARPTSDPVAEYRSGFAELNARRIVIHSVVALVCADVALFLLDIFVAHHGDGFYQPIRLLFNITREDSLPTWYASTKTLVVGAVLWAHFGFCRFHRRAARSKFVWAALAVLFTYMAVDDGSRLHERIGVSLYAFTGVMEGAPETDRLVFLGYLLELFPSYPWQVVFAPFLVATGLLLLYVIFWETAERRSQLAVLVGLGCLVLAVGLDFVEGLQEAGNVYLGGFLGRNNTDVIHYLKATEELIEMLGMTLLYLGFASNLFRSFPIWSIRFHDE